MITKWKLFNFKSVREETELALGPLTILAGPNSSGKSSWTQSMLLISQTLDSKVTSRSVVLNGSLTKLGQFDDLRSFNSEAEQIVIGWECVPSSLHRQRRVPTIVSGQIAFDGEQSGAQREYRQLHPRLFSCDLSGVVSDEANVDQLFNLTISQPWVGDEQIRNEVFIKESAEVLLPYAIFDYSVDLDENSLIELFGGHLDTQSIVGCNFIHFLPHEFMIAIDLPQQAAERIVSVIYEEGLFKTSTNPALYLTVLQKSFASGFPDDLPHPHIPDRVIDLLSKYLGELITPFLEKIPLNKLELYMTWAMGPSPNTYTWFKTFVNLPEPQQDQIRQIVNQHRDEIVAEIYQAVAADIQDDQYEFELVSVPETGANAIHYLTDYFTNALKYLGPLRDEPKPIYPLALTVDPADIGLRGEYTAAVLDLHKDKLISFLPTANFAEATVNRRASTRTLETAVLDWLQYMGVADKVETQDRGKLGHELKVTTTAGEEPQDLTHVGVGVSQVLPILVMGLLAEEDTTLIIEQPELHLHPKVQTLLADFFLSLSLLGKQCIIETHSEYIINRLRFRVASALKDSLSSLIKIYFVEKEAGVSHFREVVVNQYGAIPAWPKGFFDQSQREAEEILRAALAKKKEERQQRRSQR